MRKTFTIILLAALAACSREVAPRQYTMTIGASKDADDPTKALSIDDSGARNVLNATWTTGEEVTVYNVTTATLLGGCLVALNDGTSTTLSGTLIGEINPSDELTLNFLSPSYDGQNGSLNYIAANCDFAQATVHVATVDGSNNITVTEPYASFVNRQAIIRFTLKKKADNSLLEIPASTPLTVSDGADDYTVTPLSATSEVYVAIPATDTVNLSTTIGGVEYFYEKTGASLSAGQYYEITLKMGRVVPLASISANTSLLNGDKASGTLGGNYMISIADGATVTLEGVTINGVNDDDYSWAGLTCLGDAVINLSGDNSVKGFYSDYPGIYVPVGHTLTIQGSGTLTAQCYSTKSGSAAGIGGGNCMDCGNITISGDVGGVTARKGSLALHSIGAGADSSCGTVTLGGTVYWDGSSYQNGGASILPENPLVFPFP